ncbi:MAG: T9SS type A sorting domain-containing protein [Saprospiraceae bacterium]|jgi:hypothetical protein|nr:T9SS type A sorting domain-containing protein [Saprospiraceae bacterium]
MQQSLYNQKYYQGYVKINAGSAIEKAKTGVDCQPGGIVQATGTHFLNCLNLGASIRDFQNWNINNSQPKGNNSYFSGCAFEADGNYSGSMASDFQCMVRLSKVDGVRFIGCSFVNSAAASTQNERKFGIYATSAGFNVTGSCNGNTYPCNSYTNGGFMGFDRGILVGNTVGLRTFGVSNADFKDNVVGIEAANVTSAFIVNSNFEVGCSLPFTVPQPQSVKANRGIMLYRCTGYKVEANHFDLQPGGGTTDPLGILVNASGHNPNEVYRNYLDGLEIGNLSNGLNKNPTNPLVGLQYLCNQNTNNSIHDFAVPQEKGAGGGIRGRQGSPSQAAGNTFSVDPQPSLSTFFHINNGQAPFTYYCSGSSCPTDYTTTTVTPNTFTGNNLCPSKLPSDKDEGKLSGTERQQFQQDFGNTGLDGETRSYAGDMLIRDYLLADNTDMAGVRGLLTQQGDLVSRFKVVDTWLEEGNTTAAQTALSDIPTQFTLAGDSLTEYNHFNSLKTLQIGAMQNGTSDEVLVANNQASLVLMAEAGDYYASAQAKALLNKVNGFTYTPEVFLPEGVGGSQLIIAPPVANLGNLAEAATVEALPNPAKQRTVFHYQLPKGEEQGRITVLDLNGREVARFGLSANRGAVEWDTKHLAEGIYIYSLASDRALVEAKRLVITH